MTEKTKTGLERLTDLEAIIIAECEHGFLNPPTSRVMMGAIATDLDRLAAARKAAEPLRAAWSGSRCTDNTVIVPAMDIYRLLEALGMLNEKAEA